MPGKRVANLLAQARARSMASVAAIDQAPSAQTSSSREPASYCISAGSRIPPLCR